MSSTVMVQGIKIAYHGKDSDDHHDVSGETKTNRAAIRINSV